MTNKYYVTNGVGCIYYTPHHSDKKCLAMLTDRRVCLGTQLLIIMVGNGGEGTVEFMMVSLTCSREALCLTVDEEAGKSCLHTGWQILHDSHSASYPHTQQLNSQSPKAMPPSGDQVFKYRGPLGDHFHSNRRRVASNLDAYIISTNKKEWLNIDYVTILHLYPACSFPYRLYIGR